MNLDSQQSTAEISISQYEFMSMDELRAHAPARLNIKEALAILRIGAATFYRLRDDDKIPGVFRVGRRTFIDRDRLLDWIEEGMT